MQFKRCGLVLWLVRYSVRALGKWGSRHEKLSMRPITGKPHAQVQTKIQSTVGLCVPSLELASHRTMLNPHLKNTLFFWLSQPPLILYSIIYYIIALEAH